MERYRVGDLILDVQAGALSSGGRRISLSPLTFDLFVALVRRAPDLARRTELLETVWHGDHVTDAALSQRVSLLRRALGDRPAAPRYIGGVRGWGYKLLAGVETMDAAAEPIRSIAVLPLTNLSHDAGQDYFADALTDALIACLSRDRTFRVVSRTTTLCYRNSDKPMPLIARELGVQAIVEGGVLRRDGRTWISAQLVRAATDEHIWAKNYQRHAAEVVTELNDLSRAIGRDLLAAIGANAWTSNNTRRHHRRSSAGIRS